MATKLNVSEKDMKRFLQAREKLLAMSNGSLLHGKPAFSFQKETI